MARKKAVEPAVKTTEVTEAEAIETRTEDIKAEETVAESKTAEAAKPKKAPARKRAAKAESVKAEPVKEKAAKAEETAKADAKAASGKAAGGKNVLHIQYGGKSLSADDLMKSAKDIWKYDLKRKVGDLKDIELYVKPEENKVYYVMNGDVTGCFDI